MCGSGVKDARGIVGLDELGVVLLRFNAEGLGFRAFGFRRLGGYRVQCFRL